MAISFVAASAVVTGANPTVAVPTGTTTLDLMFIVTASGATTTTPTGWTATSVTSTSPTMQVFYKFATASEASVALTNANTTTKAVMVTYRGVGLTDGITTVSTGTSTSATTPTQTTRVNNDYVISFYGNVQAASALTWTAPGSTTSRVNSGSSTTVKGLLIVDELKATAGLTTARTATLSGSASWAAFSISIREPQTLYWTGTGNWNSTALWKTTSGGTTTLGVPSQTDNVVFDVNSTSCTVNVTTAACTDITFASTFTGTFTGTSTLSVFGSWNDGNGAVFTGSYTGAITFGAVTSVNITSSNQTLTNNNMTFAGTGSWTLNSSIGDTNQVNAKTVTLTTGTINLNNNNINALSFSSTGTGVRSIVGTGGNSGIVVYGTNSTVVNMGVTTNLTVSGRMFVQSAPPANATGGTTRTITLGNIYAEPNAPDLVIGQAGDTVSITATAVHDLIITNTGLSATTIANTALTIYGNLQVDGAGSFTMTAGANAWTLAATSAKTITSGVTLDFPITFNGVGGSWQQQSATIIGTAKTVTLTNGTLNLNNYNFTCGIFSSNNNNVRGITFGIGEMYITGNSALLTIPNVTNLTYSGSPTFNLTYSGGIGTRTIQYASTGGSETKAANITVPSGTDSLYFFGITHVKNLNLSGFGGTYYNESDVYHYGSLTLGSFFLAQMSASIGYWIFAGTTATQNIFTNNITFDFPVSFQGTQTYDFGSLTGLQLGSTNGALYFSSGTLALNPSVSNTVYNFTTTGTTLKYLKSSVSGSQASIQQPSGTVTVTYLNIKDSAASGGATWDATAVTNVNSGNNSGWIFSGGGLTFYQNVTYTSTISIVYLKQVNKNVSYAESNITSVAKRTGKPLTITETATTTTIKKVNKPIVSSMVTSVVSLLRSLVKKTTLSITSNTTNSIVKGVNTTKQLTSTVLLTLVKTINTLKSTVSTSISSLVNLSFKAVVLAITTSALASIVKSVSVTKVITSTVTTTLNKAFNILLSIASSVVSSLLADKGRFVTLAITSTVTSTLVKQTNKLFTILVSSSNSILKLISKTITVVNTSVTTLSRQLSLIRLLSFTLINTTSMLKQVGKLLTILSIATTSIKKLIALTKSIVSSNTVTLLTPRLLYIVFTILSTSVTTISKPLGVVLFVTVNSIASIKKALSKTITLIGTLSVSVLKRVLKPISKISVNVTVTMLRFKTTITSLIASVTNSVSLIRRTNKIVASLTISIGSISKVISKNITVNVTSMFQLVAEFVLKYGAVARDTFIVKPKDRLISVAKDTTIVVQSAKRSLSIIKSRIILLFRNPNGR